MIATLIGWPARHPILALIVLFLFVIAGAASLSHWPVERMPLSPGAALRVQVDVPGIDAAQLETTVAMPIENAVASLPALRQVVSRSREGHVTVELSFASTAQRETALEDVRRRVAEANSKLPNGIDPPVVERDEPPLPPAAVYAITVDRLSDEFIPWVERTLVRPLRQLPDVGSVSIGGADNHEVLIEPDARRLASLGLSFDDLIGALRRSDEAPRRRGVHRNAVVTSASVDAVAARAVRLPDGETVALGEVAEVAIVAQPATEHPRYGNVPALLLRVYPKHATSASIVAERVNDHIAWLRANGQLRAGVAIHPLVDEAREARRWVRSTLRAAAMYTAVTLLAVYLFFGWRPSVVYVGALIAWLLASATLLSLFDLSLNVMSVAALMIACIPLTMMVLHSLSLVIAAILVVVAATLPLLGGEAMRSASLMSMVFAIATSMAAVVAWLTMPWHNRDSKVPLWFARQWPRLLRASLTMALIAVMAGVSLRTLFTTAADDAEGEFIVRIRGDDPKRLTALGDMLLRQLPAIPNVDSLMTSWATQQQWQLNLDTQRLEDAELGLADVGRALAIARNGLVVGEIADADVRLPLRLQLAPAVSGPGFERLLLRGEYRDRRAVYLRDVGSARRIASPRELLRIQNQPAVELTAWWRAPQTLIELTQLSKAVSLPAGYAIYWNIANGAPDTSDEP